MTPNSSNDVDASFKDKASFSWTSDSAGQTIIRIQNTGDSEFTETYKFELARDPLFFTYSILVIIAGVVVIGFSAGFSAKSTIDSFNCNIFSICSSVYCITIRKLIQY